MKRLLGKHDPQELFAEKVTAVLMTFHLSKFDYVK